MHHEKPDDQTQAILGHAADLQHTINSIAAEWFAEFERQNEQRRRFHRIAALLDELSKARQLIELLGEAIPNTLSDEAQQIWDRLNKHGCLKGESAPPADPSAN